MDNKQKHTAEPWALDKEIDGVYADSITWVKGGWGLVCKTTNQTRCNFTPSVEVCEANAKRIVDCVNALDGIDDVSGFIEEMKGILEGGKDNATSVLTQDQTKLKLASLAIEEALALFPKSTERDQNAS